MGAHQSNKQANRLIQEPSPYLLQHAHNPVDWHPWGDEAFAQARAENKLVLVSVGYSSCHWCHVMERECFEDEAIARLMNAHYVCIKVDREERPDVDHVYMTAVQLLTGRGGWPLNCFALPDGRPVYGGTYFPPAQWTQVLTDLHATWEREPQRVERQGEKLRLGVVATDLVEPPDEPRALDRRLLDEMVSAWEPHFDRMHGGPDHAPKFPLPNNHQFLLRQGALTKDQTLLDQVELTLDRMALGGLFDQLGGGVARYSTDVLWKVPHFEKMLYDNAQFVSLYSEAYQHFRKPLYKATVERTLDFVDRWMTSADGLFHSALDADTEGEEGAYYVWTRTELEALLGAEFDLATAYYNVNDRGHWEHGRHILLRDQDDEAFAAEFGIAPAELAQRIAAINAILLDARSKRPAPGLDDKCLTSWNALMVMGYRDAALAFDRADWMERATAAMDQLLKQSHNPNGGLRHSIKQGRATINGYLEDYCFVIEALVALYEATFDERWLEEARALVEHVLRHFPDKASGLFHFTSDLDPPLITRHKELIDSVVPASNSSLAKGLFRLGTLLDEQRYRDRALRMLHAVSPQLAGHPSGHSNWGQLLQWTAFPQPEIAITGPDALQLRRAFGAHHVPNALFLGGTTSGTLPLLQGRFLPSSTIFVCVDKACQLPVATVDEALNQLP
jgi:uncharacterized protein YyaL (SSP411 family)